MAMTDNILFVKEAKTCSYVLVVHTPRLCGEPGFKSRRDAGEEALIRCREVVTTLDSVQSDLPEADHPLKVPRRKTVLPPPQAPPKKDRLNSGAHLTKSKEKAYGDLFRKALQAIMDNDGLNREQGSIMLEELSDDGDVIVEFLDDMPANDGEGTTSDKLVEALRAAGFDVKTQRLTPRGKGGEKEAKRKPKNAFRNNHGDDDPHHDEL